jgi:hypothetical protein
MEVKVTVWNWSAQCSHEPLPDFSVHHKHTAEPPTQSGASEISFGWHQICVEKKSNSLGCFASAALPFLWENSSTFLLALASWAGRFCLANTLTSRPGGFHCATAACYVHQ